MDDEFDSHEFEQEAFKAHEQREKMRNTLIFRYLKIVLVLLVVLSLIGFAIFRAFMSQFYFV
ncbi:MAG: hypothetical protein ACMXYA_00735 [Candidatus Woesearchaeota archaeon]